MARARRYHHPDLRQTLLDGAVELINAEGLRNFSLRKLASQAGVSHAAPYRHFESKDEILATLMLEGHRRLRTELLAVRDRTRGKAADRMLAMSRAYLEFARLHPAYLHVMFSREAITAAIRAKEKFPHHHEQEYDSFGVVEAAVRECQAERSLDPKADVGALAMLIWAQVHGLALLRNEGMIAGMSEVRGRTETQTLEAIFKAMRASIAQR